MEKPFALLNRNSSELRALLVPGKATLKTADVVAIVRWAAYREMQDRGREVLEVSGRVIPVDEMEEEIEELKEEAKEIDKEHGEEIEALQREFDGRLKEAVLGGQEIQF